MSGGPAGAGAGGSSRWRELDRHFREALKLSEEERKAYLRDVCRRRPDLCPELRELVDAAGAPDDFLDPARRLVSDLLPEALEERVAGPGEVGAASGPRTVLEGPGSRVGDYRLVEVIGRGGMATVYRAERSDGSFERDVAIKVLRVAAGAELENRFRAERQILAGFEHPNIARLLDGGTTSDGRPYLVLELVQGTPITRYAEERGLSVESRMELMVTVCRAVHHANVSLVVHRDLKPSNVLVTDDGQVKLLDFGIAKLLAEMPGGPSRVRTRTGRLLLTPEYATPEQVRGEAVTTASDVYQLGVLLYELLAGRRPHRLEGRSVTALERAICRRRPEPPSARAGDRVPADLDHVALMALRKVPQRRYSSADALAADLERFLDGRPVRARPDRWTYRLRRFVRRNRWAVAAGTAAAVALGGFGLLQRSNALRLAEERDRARTAAAKAEQVKEFTLHLFRPADPSVSRGEEVTARELLAAGAVRVRTELSDQPLVRAELLYTMAEIYSSLGLRERGAALSREARTVRRAELPRGHRDRARSELQAARLAALTGESGATGRLLQAVEAVREAFGSGSAETAEAYHLAALRAPDLSGADRRALDDTALAILEARGGEEQRLLARVLVESLYYGSTGWTSDSTRLWRALALRRELEGGRGPAVASTLADIGTRLESRDRDRAVEFTRQALEMYREVRGPRHPVTLTIANNLAGLHRDRRAPGDLVVAERLYRELLATRRQATEDPAALAYTLYGLGRTLVEQGRGGEAEAYLREVLELDVFPPEDGRHALIQVVLGRALVQQERLAEAEAVLRSAAAEGGGARDVDGERLEALAALYDRWGRAEEAARAREALAAFDGRPELR